MIDCLIKNAIVVTQNENREILKTNIGIKNGIITYLGLDKLKAKKYIDANNMIITPAFVNTHIHFGEYYLRGYLGKINTEKYIELGEKFYKKFKKENDNIRKSSINNVVCESILSGSLTLMGVRGWPYVSNMPVNAFLGYPIMNSNKKGGYISEFEKRFFELDKKENTNYFIGLHSIKWVDKNTLRRLSDFVKANTNIKLSVHVCESKEEIEYVYNKYNLTPIQVLDKYNLLNQNTLLIHCCYLTENDINLIHKSNASVVSCFNSNLKLGNNYCDINKLIKNNINVMIGTDGPATCDGLNILDVAKTTALLTKISVQEIFDMITVNPAKYLGINVGKIEKGCKADLLFFCKNTFNFTYEKSIINNLLYSSAIIPKNIMKDGKMISKDKKFKRNVNKIIREKNKVINFIEKNGSPN